MNNSPATWARWLLPFVTLVAVLALFRDELPFLGEAWDALLRASPAPLALAAATAFGAVFAMAAAMTVLMNIQGRIAGFGRCTALTLASNAWSTSVPGGPAVSAWFAYNVHRAWGASTGLCGWFFVISGALSTVWLVVLGILAVAVLGAALSPAALAGSLVSAIAVALGLFWAPRNPDLLKRAVRFVPARVGARLEEVIDQVSAIRMGAGAFAATASFSLANRLFDAATFYLAALAVTGDIPLRTAVLAFVMTKLAGAAQITPGGVGTVEAVTTGVLAAAGMPLADATATALVYRLVSFVLVTAVGWVVYLARYAGHGFIVGAPEGAGR